MKMFVSRGGKAFGGALILDYPPENPPYAVRSGGKIFVALPGLIGGAVHYVPSDCNAQYVSGAEIVISDDCVGRSILCDCDDPRR